MVIHLIRHGETAGNARRVLQVPETPLNETGQRQAEALGRRFRTGRLGGILASDLARAEMTARALAEATGAPLRLTPLLHERNFGDLRGTAYEDLDSDPFAAGYAPPGGETWETFHERVDRAWAQILGAVETTDGDLAVVTHGLVCHSIVERLVTLGPHPALGPDHPALRFRNTSVTLLRGPQPFAVESIGCVRHLDDLPAPDPGAEAPTGL